MMQYFPIAVIKRHSRMMDGESNFLKVDQKQAETKPSQPRQSNLEALLQKKKKKNLSTSFT